MRWSAEKLRWILLGGALLLAGIVAALFGLANYRAGKVWQRILARNGVNVRRETDGYTYSQSDGKRTIFTLHAAKAFPHGENKWSLRDAVLILYNKDGRTDRIYGNEFEYDQKGGVARALGDVHMDLEVPAAPGEAGQGLTRPDLSFMTEDASAVDPALIHVRTSGLVYTRKLALAATDQPTEFRYKGLTCTSRGAEFDSGQDALRLLADVHLAGMLRNAPFLLTAARAVLDRGANTTDLVRPEIVSQDKTARAAHALLHLRRDGSLDAGDADGGVQMHSGTETVTAPQMHAVFGAENKPQSAHLFGGVTFADADTARSSQGSAKAVDLNLSPSGALTTAVADNDVSLLVTESTVKGVAATRELHSQHATASFSPDRVNPKRSTLHLLHLAGAAVVTGQSPAKIAGGTPERTQVQADNLTTTFIANGSRQIEPQNMIGVGHTQLQQSGAENQHGISTGDALDVSFAQRQGSGREGKDVSSEVASAVQTGHVVLRSWPATKEGAESSKPSVGHAEQAVFTASAGTLTLTGTGNVAAEIEDGATDLRAPSIVLHQGTGDGEASGGVIATTSGENSAAATHILATRAALLHKAGLSQFFGTDARPAQLWQGGSQIQAASITLNGQQHLLSARPELAHGRVNAVFASAGQSKGLPAGQAAASRISRSGLAGGASATASTAGSQSSTLHGASVPDTGRDAVQVRAATMDYNDLQHEATFTGDVVMHGSQGEIAGEHGAAFLAAPEAKLAAPEGKLTATAEHTTHADPPDAASAPGMASLGGRLERLVLVGDVQLKQPGRTGSGTQMTYTAATSSFVLTGTPLAPPRIHDAQQGLVTGATLVFGGADSSIVVAGMHASGKSAGSTRVHTETDLQK
ncbi:MAG: hypothetical protein ACRYFU_09890 [Janthinobacterium lividum]